MGVPFNDTMDAPFSLAHFPYQCDDDRAIWGKAAGRRERNETIGNTGGNDEGDIGG